jgi:hypothetical protein
VLESFDINNGFLSFFLSSFLPSFMSLLKNNSVLVVLAT